MAEVSAALARPERTNPQSGAEDPRFAGSVLRVGPLNATSVYYTQPVGLVYTGSTDTLPVRVPALVWQGSVAASNAANIFTFDLSLHGWYTFSVPGSGAAYICMQEDWAAVAAAVDAVKLEVHTVTGWRRGQPKLVGGPIWRAYPDSSSTSAGQVIFSTSGAVLASLGAVPYATVAILSVGSEIWFVGTDSFPSPNQAMVRRFTHAGTSAGSDYTGLTPAGTFPSFAGAGCYGAAVVGDTVWILGHDHGDTRVYRVNFDGTPADGGASYTPGTHGLNSAPDYGICMVGAEVWVTPTDIFSGTSVLYFHPDFSGVGNITLPALNQANCDIQAIAGGAWVADRNSGFGVSSPQHMFRIDATHAVLGTFAYPWSGAGQYRGMCQVGSTVWVQLTDGTIYRLALDGTLLGTLSLTGYGGASPAGGALAALPFTP